ncbi:MAG: polysaccharide biosynthesis/export family protein [Pseudomonadota bacterium]
MRLADYLRRLALSIAVLMVAACASDGAQVVESAPDAEFSSAASALRIEDYKLGPSDKVRLIVYGEPDLSGEFAINGAGQISLPLLGEVDASGLTIEGLRGRIADGLSAGYVRDARVAAEIVTYRPYYILGEVKTPGEYPYSAGMSVMKAVAAAQGFTYRAKKNAVFIKRENSDTEEMVKLSNDVLVYPGDVIRVGERFF